MMKHIRAQAEAAVRELIEVAGLRQGELLVVGCSSSEIVGGSIGHASSTEAADAVFAAIAPILAEKGIYLAAQCCEHLNRALIIEAACAEEVMISSSFRLPLSIASKTSSRVITLVIDAQGRRS